MPRRLALLLAIALVLTACGGDDDAATPSTTAPETTTTEQDTTTTTERETTTTERETTTTVDPVDEYTGPVAPLNGLPVEDESLLERRVLAIKIDNHPNARPQSGLLEADAVLELLVEGGFTRFMALFHTTDVDELGPVRSGRPTDPTLARPLGATMVISGAQSWVVSTILNAGVPLIGEGPGTYRISWRSAPHNLYASTTSLRDTADARGHDDEFAGPLYEVAPWEGLPADTADEIELRWDGSNVVTWDYEDGRYLRSVNGAEHQWFDPDGELQRVAVDVLVVIEGAYYTVRSLPSIETTGSGPVTIFSEGRVLEGRWERAAIEDPFTFTDADGEPITVPPGQPWVSVFPTVRSFSWS